MQITRWMNIQIIAELQDTSNHKLLRQLAWRLMKISVASNPLITFFELAKVLEKAKRHVSSSFGTTRFYSAGFILRAEASS